MKRLFLFLFLLTASLPSVADTEAFHQTIERYRQAPVSQYEPSGKMTPYKKNNWNWKWNTGRWRIPDFPANTFLNIIFGLIAASVLIGLGCYLAPVIRQKLKKPKDSGTSGDKPLDVPEISYWDSMRRLAGQGDYSNAIFEGYRLLLNWADSNHLVRLTTSGTPIEYYLEFPDNEFKPDIARLTRLMLTVRYGNREVSAEDYNEFETIIRQLSQR
ncbi:MAG: DUF4129 domain-containing protein [Paludibacteraceae bacterium]|nr:DUF4129 domain-containing protein [Paludibacteraceae bacterium]